MTILLENDAAVETLVATLVAANEPFAVDLEADGMWAFRSSIRVVQLATRAQAYVIDPMALQNDVALLAPLFSKAAPLAIFHDVSSDARLLVDADLGALGTIYDTQVAARFLGYTRLGLSAMTEALVGVPLDKGLQTHDWRKRPLTAEQLVYLAGDVVHLHALYDALTTRVAEAELVEEVAEETRYVVRQARAAIDEARKTPAWARVKGIGSVPENQLARLRIFAALRTKIAETHDVPETRLLPNDALLWLARQPQVLIDGDPKALRAKLSPEERASFTEAAREALNPPPLPDDERVYIPRNERDENDRVRQRIEAALTTFRAEEAARRERDLQAVLPGHCVRDLARIRPQNADELKSVPGLGDFRIARYGDALLAAVARGRDANAALASIREPANAAG